MAGLIPIGKLETASDVTTGAVIRQAGSWAQQAVDERIEGVAADIIANDPTLVLAAVDAVTDAGDLVFYRQDGARNYLGNSDFAVQPSDLNAPVAGNWYNITGVRTWESITDGPNGAQHVVRVVSGSGFALQQIDNIAALGLPGKKITLSVTARGIEYNGIQFCKVRLFVSDQAGTILDTVPTQQFGLGWGSLDVDVTIPATSTRVTIGFGLTAAAGNGSGRGDFAFVGMALAGADINKVTAEAVDAQLATREVITAASGDARWPRIGEQTAPVLPDWLGFSKGGVVGTGGKIPVALRYDDWQDQILSLGLVDEMRNRGLFGSIVLCSRLKSNPWNQVITWDNLRTWNQDYGMEVWSHGTDHNTPEPEGYAGFYREIVTSKQQIEAEGIRVMGFSMPGVAAPGYGPELDNGDWSTLPGRMLTATYPLVETDMTRSYRHLPSDLKYGLGHFTISDGATLDASKDMLDGAINWGYGIQFMIHAGNLGSGSNMTVAQLLEFYDYLAAKVTAGEIVIVEPSTLPFCDPTRSDRLNLLGNGDFTRPVSATPTGAGTWVNVTGGRSVQAVADGPDGQANVLRVTDGSLASQSIPQYQFRGLSGQAVIFEGMVRSVGGASTWRVGTDALEGAGIWSKTTTGPATAEWTKVRFVFTPPPTVLLGVLVALGRLTAGTVEWADVTLNIA